MEIQSISDVRGLMLENYNNGLERGTDTYFKEFNNAWSWRPGEVNLVTGYQNEGKSLFLRQLCMAKYLNEGKKFLFASPEDAPAESFYDDMVHTLCGVSTDKSRVPHVSLSMYEESLNILGGGLNFVKLPYPDNTIPKLLEDTQNYIEENELYGLIIDPILKFNREPDAPERDDLYAAQIMSMLVEFSREHKLSIFMVMHQQTPKKNGQGLFDKPNPYYIKGGGSWADGTDNIIFLQRPNYANDRLDTSVCVGSLKIKKQKLVGIPQDFNISFDRKSNRYIDSNNRDIFNFDKFNPLKRDNNLILPF